MNGTTSVRSLVSRLTLVLLSGSFLLAFAAESKAATINVPSDFATVQTALDNAADGDTVLVAAGFYSENLILPDGVDVILKGSGAASTTIDGSAAGSVITISGGQSRATVVEGFTIQNGSASDGGGIMITLDSSPTIRKNTIRMNTASSAGGGIKVSRGLSGITGSNPLIEFNRIEENISTANGAGIHVIDSTAEIMNNKILNNEVLASPTSSGGGIKLNFTTTTVLVSGNTISGNTAVFAGGGISVFGADPGFAGNIEIIDNVIFDNSAEHGGGLHLETQVSSGGGRAFVVRDNCIYKNSATGLGGGIHTFMEGTSSSVEIANNDITNNTCANAMCTDLLDPDCCKGGAISAIGGTEAHLVKDNSFRNNTADVYGAGLFNKASAFPDSMLLTFEGNEVVSSRTKFNYPGITCVETLQCNVNRNTFSDNQTEPEPGDHNALRNPGALYLKGNQSASIENNFFFENFGSQAGAVHVTQGATATRIANNTFADNVTGASAGGTVRVESDSDFINNIFSGDNYAVRVFGGPNLWFLNNNFRDQSSGIVTGGPVHATVASLNSEPFASGNLDLDPGFLNPASDLYRLGSGSLLLNAAQCSEAPADDFDGEPRPLGGGCDIGADEFNTAGTTPPIWPNFCNGIFSDGFEFGDTCSWSNSVP